MAVLMIWIILLYPSEIFSPTANFITDAISHLQPHSISLFPLSLSLCYLALSPQLSIDYLTLPSPTIMIIE
jgi:hypothetical protein